MNKEHKPTDGGRTHRSHDIVVLAKAAKEGHDILSEGQYLHVKDLIKLLVDFGSQNYQANLRVEQFGEFWELKEKGGMLGKINLRVYFRFNEVSNEIVVLHTYKKEDDGAAPPFIMKLLRNRWNHYLNGTFDTNLIRYSVSKGTRVTPEP
ncbi:hypothetical protein AB1L30_23045 [Bremerella sp. JC817]|uniref:hypothetical protein n=1 Tax=Bremerella sp. JC817 TaxID=3231756 RepID=UPI00345765CA